MPKIITVTGLKQKSLSPKDYVIANSVDIDLTPTFAALNKTAQINRLA